MSGDELASAVEAAERWAIFDPDVVTRGQLDRLVDAGDPQLAALFAGRLTFGTAGLRGAVGVGPNRMNALVVRQTCVAVVRWLLDEGNARGGEAPTVLIGYDARPNSAAFARHAAAAVDAVGGRAELADRALPTPVVAHALNRLGAAAAIVITASHNPPGDNGLKLYGSDGMQIVSPAEDHVAAHIDSVAASWAQLGPLVDDAWTDRSDVVDAGVWLDAHRRDALAHHAMPTIGEGEQLGIVYTAMHGVGGKAMLDAFAEAGRRRPHVVASQFEPDGTFPTVPFPNPEEPGALDAAFSLAAAVGADLVLAHDPDADRLAVAARTRTGELALLSGDQLGALLGDHLLARLGSTAGQALVARSAVSGRLLDRIADDYGATCAVTLTGFKWIARAASDHPHLSWCFGYEEAIGYCVGTAVRDKDGIGAALTVVELAERLAARGATLWQRYDELQRQHGVHLTEPVTRRFDAEPSKAAAIVDRLAEQPPSSLAGTPVVAAGPVGGGLLPPTPGVELRLDDASRVIVRPSGTEPKVKAYLEVVAPVVDDDLSAAEQRAAARLAAVRAAVSGLLDD